MPFDLAGARKAGYSDAEIASYLSTRSGFNAEGARKAGYADSEIIAHLAAKPMIPGAAPGMAAPAATNPTPAGPEPGLIDKAVGLGEAGLNVATGATGGLLGMAGGTIKGMAGAVMDGTFGTPQGANNVEQSAMQGARAMTYAPRTEAGQEYAAKAGEAMQNLAPLIGLDPLLAAGMQGAGPAVSAVGGQVANAGRRVAAAFPKAAEVAPEVAPVAQAAKRAAPVAADVPKTEPLAWVDDMVNNRPARATEAPGPEPFDQFAQRMATPAAKESAIAPDPFLQWLQSKGGVNFAEKADTGLGTHGVIGNRGAVFKKSGKYIDELTVDAASEGWLPVGEGANENAMRDLIAKSMKGQRIQPIGYDGGIEALAASRAEAALQAHLETKLRILGVDPMPARGDTAIMDAYLQQHELGLIDAALNSAADEVRGAAYTSAREAGLTPDMVDVQAKIALASKLDEAAVERAAIQSTDQTDFIERIQEILRHDSPQRPQAPARGAAPYSESRVVGRDATAGAGEPAQPAVQPSAAEGTQPAARPQVGAQPAPMSAEALGKTARSAGVGGLGSDAARKVLAEQAAPDARTVAAAGRLGVGEHLQADHVTTNEAFRQVVAAIKSNPQSKIALAERAGLEAVAKRASDLIEEIGGTNDLSGLSASVKARMQTTQAQLEAGAEKLYDKVTAEMPKNADVAAPSTLDFLAQQASDLGGADRLTPREGKLLSTLGGGDGAITYAFLDRTRKEIGQAMRKASGPFADSESGLLKKLYSTLAADQKVAAEAGGVGDMYAAAQALVAQRKALETDLQSLFGKHLDASLARGADGGLGGAVTAASRGDSARLARLVAAVPESMRQEVVASGLGAVFRKAATRGEMDFTGYVKWYEGLKRNRQAYSVVMSNLPLSARKQLEALYRVSKGISESLNRRSKNGILKVIKAEMMGTDSLMENLLNAAKRSGAGLAAEAITTPLGVPGAGIAGAVGAALTKGKTSALSAVDDLLVSPEFAQLAQAAPEQKPVAVKRLAHSKAFTRFMSAIEQAGGSPREFGDRERWILQSMQPHGQQQEH